MKEYIPIKLTKDELDDISALVDFNHATDYKEAFGIKLGKNSIEEYIVMDSYCKNPDCTCKDIVIDFVERNDEKIIGTKFKIDYNYETKKILSSEGDLPVNFEKDLVEDDEMHEAFQERHSRIRAAFKKWQLKNPSYRPKTKIGRNDFCFCGSGKKYKKCCG